MIPLIVFAAIVVVPVLWAFVFRVSSVMLFLSIATGSVLQHALGESSSLALSTFYKNGPNDLIADIGLLCLPVIITLLVLRKSMRGTGALLQLVPLVAAGAALGALMLPLLPGDFQGQIYNSVAGDIIKQSVDVVVATAAGLNLLLAWRVYRHREDHHGKHHKG